MTLHSKVNFFCDFMSNGEKFPPYNKEYFSPVAHNVKKKRPEAEQVVFI